MSEQRSELPPRRCAISRSRLETSPVAPLTLHFLVALLEKTFAFAILAFHFRFAGVLLHVVSKSKTDADGLEHFQEKW